MAAIGKGSQVIVFKQDVNLEDGWHEAGSELTLSSREALEYVSMGWANTKEGLEAHEAAKESILAEEERLQALESSNESEPEQRQEGVPDRAAERSSDLRSDLSSKSKADLKSLADDRGVEYSDSDSKQDLVDKVAADIEQKG